VASKQSQGSVTPEFIYSAFVIVNFVNEDFEDLIHEAECLFRTESLSQRSKTLHVHEHDGDVPPLSFYPLSLSEDLFREATGEILLDLGKLFIEGEVF
jgi:hypothetical protein